MRKRIYLTVHVYDHDVFSLIYKYFMIAVIVLSLIPLTMKESTPLSFFTDCFCLVVYVADFALRWISADYKFNLMSSTAFLKFPFRFISIIDLLSIFALMSSVFSWKTFFGSAGFLAVFRIVRIFKYSNSVRTIMKILAKSKKPLFAVGTLALGYILISSIIIFNVEPQSFSTFFDAVYWATISLTTVGYGDIYPITTLGRTVAMASSYFGIAIVALPAGIVTAEYMNSIKQNNDKEE